MIILYLLLSLLSVVFALKTYNASVCDISEHRFNQYANCLENDSDYKLDISLRRKCNAESGRESVSGIKQLNYESYLETCKFKELLRTMDDNKHNIEMRPKINELWREEDQKCFQKLPKKSITIVGFFHAVCNATEDAYNEYLLCRRPLNEALKKLYQKCYEEIGVSYHQQNEISFRKFQINCAYRECEHNLINTTEYKQLKIYSYKNLIESRCEKKVFG